MFEPQSRINHSAACNFALYEETGISLHHEEGCVYGQTGMAYPLFNGALFFGPCNNSSHLITHVHSHFERQKIPYCWWIESSVEPAQFYTLLKEKNVYFAGPFSGMSIDLKHFQPLEHFHQIEVAQTLKDWSEVVGQAFEMSELISQQYRAFFESVPGSFIHAVGKKESQVVSTGTLLIKKEQSFIYNIATLPNVRHEGYASELTSFLLSVAKNQGAQNASLISNPSAYNIYQKLGMKKECTYNLYLYV